MENNKSINDFSKNSFLIYIIAIVLIWVISIIALELIYVSNEARGQFGDSFGALNALFSGLAFAGIIFTIQLQRKELQLQREELTLTRKELQRSALAQEKSEEALREQVKNLANSSKISALSTLIEGYTAQLAHHNMGDNDNTKTRAKREKCIKELESYINRKYKETRANKKPPQ